MGSALPGRAALAYSGHDLGTRRSAGRHYDSFYPATRATAERNQNQDCHYCSCPIQLECDRPGNRLVLDYGVTGSNPIDRSANGRNSRRSRPLRLWGRRRPPLPPSDATSHRLLTVGASFQSPRTTQRPPPRAECPFSGDLIARDVDNRKESDLVSGDHCGRRKRPP